MANRLVMRAFDHSDNPALSTWFADAESTRWLESAWSDEELVAIDREAHGRNYVATIDDVVVGSIGCYLAQGDYTYHHLSYIHVSPRHRRQGIARALLRWLTAEQHPAAVWKTLVHPANVHAVNLLMAEDWLAEQPDGDYQIYRKGVVTAVP